MDISGRKVKSSILSDTNNIFSVENLFTGVYFVRIIIPENEIVVKKLVIIK